MICFAGASENTQPSRRKDMNDPRTISRAYSDWFEELIIENIGDPSSSAKSIFFVTLTFKNEGSRSRRRLAEGNEHGRLEMDAFHHVYNRVCRRLIGRNFHRESHRDQLPMAVPFLDAQGSKFWRSVGDLRGLHIHSIWIVDKERSDEFHATFEGLKSAVFFDRVEIDAIDVQRVDVDDRNAIAKVISYSSKMVGFNNRDLRVAEDFRVYPMAVRAGASGADEHQKVAA
jgi:hypothetical protein